MLGKEGQEAVDDVPQEVLVPLLVAPVRVVGVVGMAHCPLLGHRLRHRQMGLASYIEAA